MNLIRFSNLLSTVRCATQSWFVRVSLAVLLLGTSTAFAPALAQSVKVAPKASGGAKAAISASDFSRMVKSFSEEEGNFPSDNYISNENAYLLVVSAMKQQGVTGGAYIGVGPEQNFTYIAKVRPEIAFIVDIRREAIIQHLMYKAIFQKAATPAEFLSLLFSKPIVWKGTPPAGASLGEIVEYFSNAPSPKETFDENLASIRKTIEKDFEFPLSEHDVQLLTHVYGAFHEANLGISTRWYGGGSGSTWYGGFPTLKDLLLETDEFGRQGNFLASRDDYEFVRDLHRKNRIIPVVGDFAGTKAFAVVADYLKENGYAVSAMYTSNVEQYLFGDRVFKAYAENVRLLPINDRSSFIRSVRGGGYSRSFSGRRMSTVLQKMSVFLKEFDAGAYPDYGRFVNAQFPERIDQ